SLRLLSGLREIADDYDGFILDLWGVLHDGTAPFPGVLAALSELRQRNKRIAILSNAPRRAALVAERLTEIGIPPSLYDHIHSSGEEAWQHLKRRDDDFYRALGRVCYHIGPWGWNETVADYQPVLDGGRAHDLPMVCANPDLVVVHRGSRVICAGALAQRYEEMGGRVRWHGKPFAAVYETCFALLQVPDRRRILAVGDSLRTDIAGANGVGIDSLLVAGGIHAEEFGLAPGQVPDRDRLAQAVAASGHVPSAALAHFG